MTGVAKISTVTPSFYFSFSMFYTFSYLCQVWKGFKVIILRAQHHSFPPPPPPPLLPLIIANFTNLWSFWISWRNSESRKKKFINDITLELVPRRNIKYFIFQPFKMFVLHRLIYQCYFLQDGCRYRCRGLRDHSDISQCSRFVGMLKGHLLSFFILILSLKRDGPLEITGGGVTIPKNNSCEGNLSKKNPASGDTWKQ